MPKYGIHHIILDETIEALRLGDPTAQAAARLLERFPFEANMGAIGPDMFFFLEDYDIISMVNMAKPVLEFFAEIAEVVEDITEPFIKIHNAVGQAADAALDTLGLSALTNVKDSLEATEKLFGNMVNRSIASGMLEKALPLQTSTDYRFNATSTFTRLIREMFEDYLVPPLQRNVEEPDWYWFDMLHYRNTGDFAKALVRNADTDQKKAYALAYLTHIGTDLVGHPYVNQIVGGPFRLGVQRHVTVENFMDVQAYREKYGQEISETLYDDLGFEPDFPADIAQLLATAATEAYKDVAHPHLLNGELDQVNATYFENGIFTADHVQSAYKLMRITLKMMGGNKDLTPTPPTATADMDLSEIMAELESLDPPPAPPAIPGLLPASYEALFSGEMTIADLGEALAAAGLSIADWADSMAAYLAEFAAYCVETAKLLLVLAKNMLANTADFLTRDLLALLYGIQKTLYEMLQASRHVMALNGLMYPHSAQINDAVSQSLLSISDPDLHYVANDTNLAGLKGRLYPKLRAKGQSHLMAPMYETECMATIPAFHTPASLPGQSAVTPQHFMRQQRFSAAALAQYANANSPEQAAQLRENGHVIGNAVALCSWMIRNAENPTEEDTVFANWNLDGDRGYAAKSWSGILPPNSDYSSQAKLALQLLNPGTQTQISPTDAMPFLHRICDADPANDYRFANIKAKQERFENRRSHSDFNIANLVLPEGNIPLQFRRYDPALQPADWAALLAPRLAVSNSGWQDNVYHMNGVVTPADSAFYEQAGLEKTLGLGPGDLNIRLLYNDYNPALPLKTGNNLPTVEDPALRSEIAGQADIIQAAYDKIWSYGAMAKMFKLSWANPASLPQKIDDLQLGQATLPVTTANLPPIENPATIAVIALLNAGMVNSTPLSLIGYSHGTQIIFNGMLAFSASGNRQRDYLKNSVKTLFLGRMVSEPSVFMLGNMLLGFEDLVNPNDVVPNVVGSLPVTSIVWDQMTAINLDLSTGEIQLYLVEMLDRINMEDHRLYRYIQMINQINAGNRPRILSR